MVQVDDNDSGPEPGQYLTPGEKLLRYSSSVGIKKFYFNAYLTDRRIFLVDRNEKKTGLISKEIPRDVVMGSHLESSGSSDPFLVLTIRTLEDETRTMKIAFIQEANERTAEIEEWISYLHGRSLKPAKSIIRHREVPVTVHKDEVHRLKPHEKQDQQINEYHEASLYGAQHPRGPEKVRPVEKEHFPGIGSAINDEGQPPVRQNNRHVPDVLEIAFCHHCGKRAPHSANFCPFCGTKLHRPDQSG